MALITDETFNTLVWHPIDPKIIGGVIAGSEVLGAEPVDYPVTDGLVIYLRYRRGGRIALDLSTQLIATPRDKKGGKLLVQKG